MCFLAFSMVTNRQLTLCTSIAWPFLFTFGGIHIWSVPFPSDHIERTFLRAALPKNADLNLLNLVPGFFNFYVLSFCDNLLLLQIPCEDAALSHYVQKILPHKSQARNALWSSVFSYGHWKNTYIFNYKLPSFCIHLNRSCSANNSRFN